MKIEINPSLESKLLQDSAQMNMSATQFVNWVLSNVHIEPPKLEPVKIAPARVKVKSDYWRDK